MEQIIPYLMEWYLREKWEPGNFIPVEYRRLKFSLSEYNRAERIVHVILAQLNKGELGREINYSELEKFIISGTFRVENGVSSHASFRHALNYLIDEKEYIEKFAKENDKRVRLLRLKWNKISSRMVNDGSWYFWEFFEKVKKSELMFDRKHVGKLISLKDWLLIRESAQKELLLDIRQEEIVCKICFHKSKFIFEKEELYGHEGYQAYQVRYYCNNCGFSTYVYFSI